MEESKTTTLINLLWFPDWRLLPWFEHGKCQTGCCSHYVFTWLFLRVHVVIER